MNYPVCAWNPRTAIILACENYARRKAGLGIKKQLGYETSAARVQARVAKRILDALLDTWLQAEMNIYREQEMLRRHNEL
jgi:hypothetical protein